MMSKEIFLDVRKTIEESKFKSLSKKCCTEVNRFVCRSRNQIAYILVRFVKSVETKIYWFNECPVLVSDC